ncbi:MAG: hypothetical protein ACFFFB_21010 [Candidatus Heimdallarchaeota archaeon]
MGLFLFVSAVKNKTPIEITASIKSYLARANMVTRIMSFSDWIDSKQKKDFDIHDIISQPISMTAIYPMQNNWSVVIYNNCHFEEKEICKFTSIQLQTLVSLIEVYDSDVWYHYVYFNGNQVDQFCSYPEEYEKKGDWQSFKGNIKKIAFYFDTEEKIIEPYFVQFNSENRLDYQFSKAHEADQYPLGNEWVFIDFWKQLGILYPSITPEILIIHE